ncbi:MAG TPA: Ref family recombination enhancement nuclease [Buttiauxella sp.]|jgi:hypothetical protein
MAKSIEERRQNALEAAKRATACAIERQRERLADPDYRKRQYEKQYAAAERRATRQREKKSKLNALPVRSQSTRGLKGRTPTAEEARFIQSIGSLPCIACYVHGVISHEVSLHHIDGRTRPGAHKKQLPLCKWHHQHAAPAAMRAQYPWLVPVHADMATGGKAEFERLNGSQLDLLEMVVTIAEGDKKI